MNLNKSKWYVRWYFWSLGICEEFLERGMQRDAELDGTNLCAFMRVILIYTPLILLIHAIVYASALATITLWPIHLFGLKGYGLIVGRIAVLIVLIILVTNLVGWLLDKRQARILAQGQEAKPTNANTAGPGFARVLGRWVVAKKRKICPLITFVERDKEVR